MLRFIFILLFIGVGAASASANTLVNYCEKIDRTAFFKGDINQVRELVDGLSRAELTFYLQFALGFDMYEKAELLLQKGADPNYDTYCKDRDPERVNRNAAYSDLLPQSGRKPVTLPNIDLIKLMLDKGLIISPDGIERIYWAAIPYENISAEDNAKRLAWAKEVILLLRDRSIDFKKTGLWQFPDYEWKWRKEVHAFMEWLFAEGIADVNRQSLGGWGGWSSHPLSYAIQRKNDSLIDFLLAHGIDVRGNGEMETPLVVATKHNNVRVLKILLERGRGLFAQEELNQALDHVVLHPMLYQVRLELLKEGAKPSADKRCDVLFCAAGWPGEGEPRFLYKGGTVTAYESASENADSSVWEVEPNEQVKWTGTRVNTTKTVVRRAQEDFIFDCGEAKKGEIIETLQYAAEGYYYILHNEKVCQSDLSYYPKTELVGDDGLHSQWWIKIQKQNLAEEGWIMVNDQNLIFLDRSF